MILLEQAMAFCQIVCFQYKWTSDVSIVLPFFDTEKRLHFPLKDSSCGTCVADK